jgi:alkaline phosphatase D
MPDGDVTVNWEISSTQAFDDVALSGAAVAESRFGHSVHATVQLDQGEWFYRFRAGGFTSEIGRTRCAPPIGAPVEQVTFATANCQNFEEGFYAAHVDIAAQRPDFVLFLGDYIYESGASQVDGTTIVRSHGAPEPKDLVGYRNRYALYRSDASLRAAHAAAPWFVMWDDHEVEDNYAGTVPSRPEDIAGFAERRFAAYQAWWEHMPVRLDPPVSADTPYRTYRNVLWGSLLGLTLLDGRQYRTDQACGDVALSFQPPCPEITAPGRTMLGDGQEQFLFNLVGKEQTVWNVIGNQTVMSDVTFDGTVLNYDQWDGYPAEREVILRHLADEDVPNVVVLTGDIHLALVGQLRAGDRASGKNVAVEFVTTSISSSGLLPPGVPVDIRQFPAMVDADLQHRGWVQHIVTPAVWIAAYRTVDDVTDPASAVSPWKAFAIDANGSNTVRTARFG